MTSKTCFKCGCEKSLDDFYRHGAMADGRLNKCKDCTKKDAFEHRHGRARDRVLAYDRERAKTPERKEHIKRVVSRWQQDHPNRRKAHAALQYAVRVGRLTPWPACAYETCEETKVEAHHPDYSRPLDVVWMCPAHHKQAHAMFSRLMSASAEVRHGQV